MTNRGSKFFLMILATGLICPLAYGQESAGDTDKWEFSATPYFWMAGVRGDVRVAGRKANVDITFNEIMDALDFAAMAHFELRNEKWGIFGDPLYMKLSKSKDVSLVLPGPRNIVINRTAEADLSMWIFELGGFYQVAQFGPLLDSKRTVKLDVLGGGRYWDIHQDLNIGVISEEVSEHWIDPFVGIRLTVPATDWLSFDGRYDFGGFSVSKKAANQTYNVFVGSTVNLAKNIGLVGGYRWLNLDRAKSSSESSNITLEGPILALEIRF